MDRRNLIVLVTLVLLIPAMVFQGCQKEGGFGPLTPGISEKPAITSQNQTQSERTNDRTLWGIWNVHIDPVTYVADIEPLREGQWHANVTQFLQPPPKTKNIGIKIDLADSDITNGTFAVDVTLTHPLPGCPQYTGFDVRGIFMADATYKSAFDDTAVFANPDPAGNEGRLLNPDGYTRWFNPTEFFEGLKLFKYIPAYFGNQTDTSATLNGYKYYSDDFLLPSTKEVLLQEFDLDLAKRGSFSDTSSITRRYMVQFPMIGGVAHTFFTYAVDASYVDPIPDDPDYPLESFSLSGNVQELYKILCKNDVNSTAFYENSSSFGGNLKFSLELFDWQSSIQPSGIMDEIGKVIVESPTLLGNYDGMIDLTDQFKINAYGGNATSSVVDIDIANVTPTSDLNQFLFITVTSADPIDYGNPWGVPFPEEPVLAAYFLWNPYISPVPLYKPPDLGPITGPNPVDETDTTALYDCDLIDPFPGLTFTFLWSIVPTGDPPDFSIPPNAADDNLEVNWCNWPVGVYDMQCQVYDGTSYDTTDIFTITRGLSSCMGSAHYYTASVNEWLAYSFYPGSGPFPDNIPQGFYMLPRMDMDFFYKGDFAGQGVIQGGNATLMNFTVTTGGIVDPPTQFKWRIPGKSFYREDPTPRPDSPRVVLSLDTSPDLDPADGYTDNRIVFTTSHHHDNIYVVDADKSCPQVTPPSDDVPPMVTLTELNGMREIPCIAIDNDDDIWALALDNAANSYSLHHWSYILDDDTGGPYYTYESGDTLDLSTNFDTTFEIDVFDMVVAFANNHLYILEVGGSPFRGTIHEIDLNTSPPTYIGSKGNLWSAAFKTSGYELDPDLPVPWPWVYLDYGLTAAAYHYKAWAGDITIDHSGADVCDPEHCRLEIMGTMVNWVPEIVRLDLDLNVLDRKQSSDTYYNLCCAIAPNSDVIERVLLCQPYAWFPYSDASLGYWMPPADW